jgi:hypothetical protein
LRFLAFTRFSISTSISSSTSGITDQIYCERTRISILNADEPLFLDLLVSYTLAAMEDCLILTDVCGRLRQTLRAPDEEITVILSQFVIWCVIQRASRTVVCTKMAKAAASVPVLGKPAFRVLWIFFVIVYTYECDASLGAYPGADPTSCAFLHVELMAASEASWK